MCTYGCFLLIKWYLLPKYRKKAFTIATNALFLINGKQLAKTTTFARLELSFMLALWQCVITFKYADKPLFFIINTTTISHILNHRSAIFYPITHIKWIYFPWYIIALENMKFEVLIRLRDSRWSLTKEAFN